MDVSQLRSAASLIDPRKVIVRDFELNILPQLIEIDKNYTGDEDLSFWDDWLNKNVSSMNAMDIVNIANLLSTTNWYDGFVEKFGEGVILSDQTLLDIYGLVEKDLKWAKLFAYATFNNNPNALKQYIESKSSNRTQFINNLLYSWLYLGIFPSKITKILHIIKPYVNIYNFLKLIAEVHYDRFGEIEDDLIWNQFERNNALIDFFTPKTFQDQGIQLLITSITQSNSIISIETFINDKSNSKNCHETLLQQKKALTKDTGAQIANIDSKYADKEYMAIQNSQKPVFDRLFDSIPLILASLRSYTYLFDREIHLASARVLGLDLGGQQWMRIDKPVDNRVLAQQAAELKKSSNWILGHIATPPELDLRIKIMKQAHRGSFDFFENRNTWTMNKQVGAILDDLLLRMNQYPEHFSPNMIQNDFYFNGKVYDFFQKDNPYPTVNDVIEQTQYFMSPFNVTHLLVISTLMLLNKDANAQKLTVYRGVPAFTTAGTKPTIALTERGLNNPSLEYIVTKRQQSRFYLSKKLNVGDPVSFNQLLSASNDFRVAARFSAGENEKEGSCSKCCIYKFELPVGYPRLAIRPFSKFHEENEIVVPVFVLKKPSEIMQLWSSLIQKATVEPEAQLFRYVISNFFQLTEPAKFVIKSITRDTYTGFTIYTVVPLNGF